MTIVSFSVPDRLLDELDDSMKKRGFASRSEVLRQAIRFLLAEYRSLDEIEGEIVATITIVYERAKKSGKTLSIQHQDQGSISTFLHTHVDGKNCIEVMVVRGSVESVKKITNAMKANEQVKQVKVTVISSVPTTTSPAG
jgi:CopG family nickel-responsive transcriptional regulator